MTTAPGGRMGGQARLRIRLAGGPELRDALLGRADGGEVLDRGLRERIAARHRGVSAEVEYLPVSPGELPPVLVDRLADPGLDVAIVSIAPAVAGAVGAACLRAMLAGLMARVRAARGAHVLVGGCSSVVPGERPRRFRPGEEPLTIRAHRANLALIELSMAEGLSIVDVDRVVAELGAGPHVRGTFRYSAEASDAICEETLRVMEEIGFFEQRPLVMQIGRRRP